MNNGFCRTIPAIVLSMLPIRFTARYNRGGRPFTIFGKSTMRCVLPTLCFLLVMTLSIQAGDKAKPNTLTPKEIAEGWILLFDGETTFGWEVDRSADKTKVKVVDGELG